MIDRHVHNQRLHIVHSLDSLLHVLLAVGFLLSPTIWNALARLSVQAFCSNPREIDPTRTHTLRLYFLFVVLGNIFGIWSHATIGTAPGRPVILDFIGLSFTPTRFQLLSIDGIILFLQLLETYIAFEIALQEPFSIGSRTLGDRPTHYIPVPSKEIFGTQEFTTKRLPTSMSSLTDNMRMFMRMGPPRTTGTGTLRLGRGGAPNMRLPTRPLERPGPSNLPSSNRP
ncbi:hypothetical protein DL96DRAFT_1601493 [Flagelloscypha sp. PMI_526]|nr:hypothetical protein DL96DRAFT_1601493 [Flagelloscypha sp. PMI_526]